MERREARWQPDVPDELDVVIQRVDRSPVPFSTTMRARRSNGIGR